MTLKFQPKPRHPWAQKSVAIHQPFKMNERPMNGRMNGCKWTQNGGQNDNASGKASQHRLIFSLAWPPVSPRRCKFFAIHNLCVRNVEKFVGKFVLRRVVDADYSDKWTPILFVGPLVHKTERQQQQQGHGGFFVKVRRECRCMRPCEGLNDNELS